MAYIEREREVQMVFKPVNSTSDAENLCSSKTNISNVLISSSKQGTESRAVPTIKEGIALAESMGLTNQPIPTGTIGNGGANRRSKPRDGWLDQSRGERERGTPARECVHPAFGRQLSGTPDLLVPPSGKSCLTVNAVARGCGQRHQWREGMRGRHERSA